MNRPLHALLAAALAITAAKADPLLSRWKAEVLPILEIYCYDCHGDGIDKGDLDFDAYPDIASMQADRETWKRIRGHVEQRIMPPLDEILPEDDERAALVAWIDDAVFPVDPENPDPGRVTLRRLNRVEYQNTLRDLLGVDVKVSDILPPDDSGYGFDNIGDVLSLSPVHLERFLESARIALDATVRIGPEPPPRIEIAGKDFAGPGRKQDSDYHLSTNGEAFRLVELPGDGRYRVTVKASGTPGGDHDPNLRLTIGETFAREWPVTHRQDSPGAYEVEVKLDQGGSQRVAAAFTNDFYDPDHPDPDRRDRNLTIHSITLEGPLDAPPPKKPASHRRIFIERQADQSDEAWAVEVISKFARRAFRRPLRDGEAERYLYFIELASDQEEDVEHGIRLALEAILVSPAFLFREEPQPEPDNPQRIAEIDEHALASRLSYFFWSSMPDDELFELAATGRLRDQLDPQINRMLDSKKADAFVSNFAGQWLQLRDLDSAQPSRRAFRDFDRGILYDMQRESEMLFEHLIRADRPLTELLDANYTFINERLAKHYGIEGVEGREMRKVSLEGTPRRGLLTHGSFLTLTSHPVRTSPVLRGKYVLENLLDTEPPPPPPNIPQLTETEGHDDSLNLRQQMEKHRDDPGCASCHALLDPIGFGLENFDGVGVWRDEEGGKPIDSAGQLASGQEFSGAGELREILIRDHRDEFYRSVASKMLTYALGRGTDWYDRPALDAIIAGTHEHGGSSRALIRGLVRSVPFQYRRGDG